MCRLSFPITLMMLGCAPSNQKVMIQQRLPGVWISAIPKNSEDLVAFVEAIFPDGNYCSIGGGIPDGVMDFGRSTWRMSRTTLTIDDVRTLSDTNESEKFIEKRKLTFVDEKNVFLQHSV
jgi:hypothetical protein